MEDNNSIVGIKVNETTIPAKCIMIIKKISRFTYIGNKTEN